MKRTLIWECKVGIDIEEDVDNSCMPNGADYPMRLAVQGAYVALTGKMPDFCFSGWNAQLTETEREVVAGYKPKAAA